MTAAIVELKRNHNDRNKFKFDMQVLEWEANRKHTQLQVASKWFTHTTSTNAKKEVILSFQQAWDAVDVQRTHALYKTRL
jgi:hypothetical protein